MQMTLPAGSSLSESIKLSEEAEKTLMDQFPEIKHVVAKIGTAEVPTDPMAVEDADVMIIMKPFKEWTSATSRAEMVEKMKEALEPLSERAEFNFSQPIQLRFNELMTGAKADIAVKLYGEDTHELYQRAKEAATYVEKVPGAADVIVEQTMGLPQLVVKYNRGKIARYGINIEELNTIIRTAYAGEASGVVFENERKFDLVVRPDQEKVADLNRQALCAYFRRHSDSGRRGGKHRTRQRSVADQPRRYQTPHRDWCERTRRGHSASSGQHPEDTGQEHQTATGILLRIRRPV